MWLVVEVTRRGRGRQRCGSVSYGSNGKRAGGKASEQSALGHRDSTGWNRWRGRGREGGREGGTEGRREGGRGGRQRETSAIAVAAIAPAPAVTLHLPVLDATATAPLPLPLSLPISVGSSRRPPPQHVALAAGCSGCLNRQAKRRNRLVAVGLHVEGRVIEALRRRRVHGVQRRVRSRGARRGRLRLAAVVHRAL